MICLKILLLEYKYYYCILSPSFRSQIVINLEHICFDYSNFSYTSVLDLHLKEGWKIKHQFVLEVDDETKDYMNRLPKKYLIHELSIPELVIAELKTILPELFL